MPLVAYYGDACPPSLVSVILSRHHGRCILMPAKEVVPSLQRACVSTHLSLFFKLGDWVDARDNAGIWRVAQVVSIGAETLRVHFPSKVEEDFAFESPEVGMHAACVFPISFISVLGLSQPIQSIVHESESSWAVRLFGS